MADVVRDRARMLRYQDVRRVAGEALADARGEPRQRRPQEERGGSDGTIKTAPQEERQFSQIPILAWGVERVYRRNHDRDLLAQCLRRLERFHEWFWRERDVTDVGLIAVGSYSGIVQHARWETFDYDCAMDDLRLTPHPTRRGPNEGAWYGDLCMAGNTAYLILGERSLARLATIAGDAAMTARREERIEKAVKAMREHMWDARAGTFLAVNRDSLEKIPVATIGSWIPLAAEVPTQEMAKRMAEVLGASVAVAADRVLTAHYLVLGARNAEVTGLDGKARAVNRLSLDHDTGLALLTVDGAGFEPARLAGEEELGPGDPVFLLTCSGDKQRRGASGHVSFVGPFEAFWEYMLDRATMTTVANPGLAGEPLLDARGGVAGIVSVGRAAVGRYSLAIPTRLFHERRERLESGTPVPPEYSLGGF